MKRRLAIGLLLGSFIFVATSISITKYLEDKALQSLKVQTESFAQRQALAFESELKKFSLLPNVLAESRYIHSALISETSDVIDALNQKLSSLVQKTGADYIFVIDRYGTTIASSNYQSQHSFIGINFEFRPYFQSAVEYGQASYFAKGELTGKGGLFLSQRIQTQGNIQGVVVVKVEFEQIRSQWQRENFTTMISDEQGVIIIASDKEMEFSLLAPLNRDVKKYILQTKQFGETPLNESPIKLDEQLLTYFEDGALFQAGISPISTNNWSLIHLESAAPSIQAAKVQSLVVILSLGIVLSLIGIYVSWRVTRDREREKATAFLKSEVAKRTIDLENSNEQLRAESAKREAINKRFRVATEELAQANRLGSIGVITTNVAHEVNQPVGAIKAFAQNAIKFLDRNNLNSVKKNLDSIIELTGRIAAITTELRRYARRDGNVLSKVSVADILDGVELLMGDRIKSARVKFAYIPTEIPSIEIKADKVRIEQILVNLIQNALEALVDQAEPFIQIRVATEASTVVIKVEDNGPNVPENNRTKIFEPFYTSKTNGVGIGLGIARNIAQEFGGTLTIENASLGGASFQLRLPKL